MRVAICESFGGSHALRIGQMPEPALEAGQVQVDVHAAAVSFIDYLMVSGKYQMKPATPFVPGTDGAGIVRAVGRGASRFRPGDRVACSHWFGAYARNDDGPELKAAPLPDGVDFDTGAAGGGGRCAPPRRARHRRCGL